MYNKIQRYLDNINLMIEVEAYYNPSNLAVKIAQIRSNIALLRDLGLISEDVRKEYDNHIMLRYKYINKNYNNWRREYEY